MKLKFPNPDVAEGFCDGLADPEGFDVYAHVEEGNVVDILGLDHHDEMLAGIRRSALSLGAVELV
jgi:hypothetical protein